MSSSNRIEVRSLFLTVGGIMGAAVLVLWLGAAAASGVMAAELICRGSAVLALPTFFYRMLYAAIAASGFWLTLVFSALVVSSPARRFVRPGLYGAADVGVLFWYGLYHGTFAALDFFLLRLIRGSVLTKLIYIGYGAKIGRGTIINSNQLSDCHLITIGSDTIIGADAVLNPHSAERGRLYVGRIIIGSGVTIGQYAIISSGSVIEDDAVVGAHAFLPKNSLVQQGAVVGGVPARRIPPENEM